MFDVVGHKVGRAVDRKGEHLARRTGEELIRIIRIEVDDADTGLFEDAALIVLVLLEIRMLVRSDMIRLDVREDAVVEGDRVDTVELEGLAGGFHHDVIAALIPHHTEVVLKIIGLRRRVLRRKVMTAVLDTGRTDAADLLAGVLQDLLNHVGGGRLALRSGDGDDRHLPARMTETCRTECREGRTRILDPNDRDLVRYRREIEPEFGRLLLDHDGLTALRDHRRDETMRIDIRSLHRVEDGPLHRFSRIKHDLMDLRNRSVSMNGLILDITYPVCKFCHNLSLFIFELKSISDSEDRQQSAQYCVSVADPLASLVI